MRVIDLSRLLPGPYCSRLLADYGFEVIKVERPGGDDATRYLPPLDAASGLGLIYRALNRAKKNMTIDLKTAEGQGIFLRLVETADVLLESFRPGVMARLGLGYEHLAAANPRLVYCSLTGYGPEGSHSQRAGHDLNYLALAGFLDLTGPRNGPPAIPAAPVADLTGALWAATGILLALVDRERTGEGQQVAASLLGGALACLPLAVAGHAGGQLMQRGGNDLTGGQVCYGIYGTRDGSYVTLAALEPQFWAAFCQAVEREDLLSLQSAPAIPGEHAYEELCALFQSRSRSEWLQLLEGVDACCEPVYTLGEALASEPVQALRMIAPDGLLPPVRLSGRENPQVLAVPTLGQHTTALLGELGYDLVEVERFRELGVV